MHYIIDGYNLLFRLQLEGGNLQSQREKIIEELNAKISLLKLDASIVFDASFQAGGHRSRSHYKHLEILYTAEGETADEFILDHLKNFPRPRQETVVTSDKTLARLVRSLGSRTESVKEFVEWLNRLYQNKIRRLKEDKPLPPASKKAPKPKPLSHIPQKETALEGYDEYYASIFESKWKEIQQQENKRRASKAALQNKPPPRKPKKFKDPFEPPITAESKETSEMERWLKLFEKS
jgi:uncharacterized protein